MLLPLRHTTSAIFRPEWYIYKTLIVLSSTPLFSRISSKKVDIRYGGYSFSCRTCSILQLIIVAWTRLGGRMLNNRCTSPCTGLKQSCSVHIKSSHACKGSKQRQQAQRTRYNQQYRKQFKSITGP